MTDTGSMPEGCYWFDADNGRKCFLWTAPNEERPPSGTSRYTGVGGSERTSFLSDVGGFADPVARAVDERIRHKVLDLVGSIDLEDDQWRVAPLPSFRRSDRDPEWVDEGFVDMFDSTDLDPSPHFEFGPEPGADAPGVSIED